ncbi:molybdate ABC transporter substrate-binding protein [Marinomonas sp. C2222]|uniref:Molybdate ABC transporter substrate-binding protein n=1 Tax=Marinomonas sargassi TaxID=2984494 RepID=A0ABT2YVD8_9GAMM|nr:molybdate ABC transporter substrate-binding protein [Marinomonas sargassi]MCV2403849.1 molybdate ABC transporter substrate-binding protein [Marinomonas sargassi]
MMYILPLLKRVLFWASLFVFTTASNAALSTDLHVAVATNFILPAKQIAQEFEAETGNSIQLSFASSGKLFAQIHHNAPYDIFLSADLIKPQRLIEAQKAEKTSLAVYAKGKLVVWSRSPFTATDLKTAISNAQHIAIANPRFAPYGVAAEESLRSLSLWEGSKEKLVKGESVGQAFQFAYSQNADIGLIALSQALSRPQLGYYLEVPTRLHKEIHQAGVVLSTTEKPVLAHQFMAFLMRADIQAKIAQFGYEHTIH